MFSVVYDNRYPPIDSKENAVSNTISDNDY